MKIEKIDRKDLKVIKVYNNDGFEFVFSPVGAALVFIKDEDTYLTRNAKTYEEFLLPSCYHGKTIGRVSNRIKGHVLEIDGHKYELTPNEGDNVLHGGIEGLSNQLFNYETRYDDNFIYVIFTYLSKDEENGFPGNLNIRVKYQISLRGCTLDVIYDAESDKKTPISFTNHSYFTLGSKDLRDLSLTIKSSRFINVDENMIAKGVYEVNDVMDFKNSKLITKDIDNSFINRDRLKGYDHYYYFDKRSLNNDNVVLENDKYNLKIFTDFEGCQIYTSNYVEKFKLKPYCPLTRNSVAIEPSDSHLKLRLYEPNERYHRHIRYVINKKYNEGEMFAMNNEKIKKIFKDTYGFEADNVFSCGGRFEILGNHTDHNHGLCLAATCNLCITAAVRKTEDKTVMFLSKGYSPDLVKLSILDVIEDEKGTSKAIIRGVAEYLLTHGYNIGGFQAYSESTIFKGAGVSSSAAFELLVGQIFNELYNEGKIPNLVLCKAGQYAENKYFGKASGLLDQIGVGYGNIVSIDFENITEPKIEEIPFPFDDLHFVIINTGGSHAELSDLYSQIPQDMYNAAKKSGVNFLRETTFEKLNKQELSDIEYSRAAHFYGENERVAKAVKAIKDKNAEEFLKMINESRKSSTDYLKNMMVEDKYAGSPLEACDYFMKVTNGQGAIKINGGGFAGSVIAVVPGNILENTIKKMAEKYGQENVIEVFVRNVGPTIIK